MTDLLPTTVTPDAVLTPTGGTFEATGDPHADNRRQFSPCPLCGANAHEGPEGDHWAQFAHCWRCGWRPGASLKDTGVSPLQPGAARALAAEVAAEVHKALGLPEGVDLGKLLGLIGQQAPAEVQP